MTERLHVPEGSDGRTDELSCMRHETLACGKITCPAAGSGCNGSLLTEHAVMPIYTLVTWNCQFCHAPLVVEMSCYVTIQSHTLLGNSKRNLMIS
jgi:hypothetical protein